MNVAPERAKGPLMGELHVATVVESIDCSWSSIVEAIRSHARTQPPETADDLNAWADLIEGLQKLDAEQRS
jgi:hypothetical protein